MTKKPVPVSKSPPPSKVATALSKLTNRHRLFVVYYVTSANLNATKAAKMAGYSGKNIGITAHHVACRPDVRAAIEEYLQEMAMSVPEALRRLTDWGRGSIEHFMRPDGSIDLNSEEARAHFHLIKKVEMLGVDENGFPRVKLELHDAKDAVVHIAKIHGMFVDRVEHSGELSGVLKIPQLESSADWAARAKSQQSALPSASIPQPLLLKGDSGENN